MSEQLNQLNVTEMRALVLNYQSVCNAELKTISIPEISSGQILVKTLFSGISRGTESLVYNGLVPESEWQNMRCPHQIGEFSFPLAYGYCCVGEVIKIAPDVEDVKISDRVFVLHPHQDLFLVDANMCTVLPETLPSARAVLSANMETALNGVWDAEVDSMHQCAVIGAGVVGLLTGFVLKTLHGINPIIVDVNPERADIAQKLGLDFKSVQDVLESDIRYQRIFNTSASGSGLQLAIDLCEFEARITEMSWFGAKDINLKLGGSFHSKRLQIISSQVGHIATPKRQTETYASRMAKVLELLESDLLDHLLEPAIAFEDLSEQVHDIFNEKSSALCQLVQYRSS